ncbi:recombinase family protein [Mesorhizobium sp. M2A.F.Ca.ET.039.01.1.1]|uniref:recombinase family protein n=1 Tax=Mesorhizobium sp. M2A.F.Ca.ET.039.01.1.1 TaxID=2496746 RepID=UPI000FCA8E7B|nr:recombinase family protein [Mesorhizobium sp. M2A.F.Ca.ET.039.01.1.1]RWX61477.1 hypothetical protein EOA24_30235 [Mesorhizobium sp. M2A.F.Ca.ET.039.01.1.1]
MKYGYARVSTEGQGLTAQVERLGAAGCQRVLWNGPPSFEASARMPVFGKRRRTSHDDHDAGN